MRIGFDISQTGAGKAGCGFFAASLLESLLGLPHDHNFLLYPDFGTDFFEPRKASQYQPASERVRLGPSFRFSWQAARFWRQPRQLDQRLGGPDIVHSHNFYAPKGLSRAKLVYTLYDLAFLSLPDASTEANRQICFEGVFGAALRADMILAISEASRAHFSRVFPHYPSERLRVIPLGSRFSTASPRQRPPALTELGSDGFFLTVGTVEPRKNYPRLLRAFALMRKRTGCALPLVVAGGKGWLEADMRSLVSECGLEGAVHVTGYLSEAELAWLYANCFAFAYPSLFEGFGLPVLEAMTFGAAVLTSKVSSLPEVAGEAALLVDPLSEDDIAQGLARFYEQESLRQELKKRALGRAAGYSWDGCARHVLAAYDEVMSLPYFNPLK